MQHSARDIESSRRAEDSCTELLRRYGLPEGIVDHSVKVAEVARFIAERLADRGERIDIDKAVMASLLHDIGKSSTYVRKKARSHAEASAEIVRKEGLPELADIVARHTLDSVMAPKDRPCSWEDKLVFYADKIVTHELVSLEERFSDLNRRRPDIKDLLEASFGPTRAVEAEILVTAGLAWKDLKARFERGQHQ